MSELFLKIINMSLSASWLVLAVLLLRLVLKKAPKWVNVLLWGIVAVRLICPFSIESALSLIPSAETIPVNIGMDTTPAINSGISYINNAVNPLIEQSNTPMAGASVNPLQITIAIYANIWVLGVLALLIYTAVSYWRLRHKVSEAVILRDNIYQSERVDSPFVLGIIRPKIYLPYHMDGRDLIHVIAHEQAHIRRRDHWWKPFGFLLLTVHWFNPLMWLAYVLLCRDIELACDEKVIKELGSEQRADYSQALVSCSINRRMVAACPLAFGEVGVKERVKSVMNYQKPTFWVVVVSVTACITAGVCFLTDPAGIDVETITAQKGYAITDQRDVELTLTIPKAALPDSIYQIGGHKFEPDEVVVYHDGTTIIYLEMVQPNGNGDEWLRFLFKYSYNLPKEGHIRLPYTVTSGGDHKYALGIYGTNLLSENIIADGVPYKNAVSEWGFETNERQGVYISTEVCQNTQDTLEIKIAANELSYKKLPRGVHGAFGHITGYGISTDPVSGRESYHIRVEDLELSCSKEQYEDVVTYMDYVLDGLIEDGIVFVTYDQFLVSKDQGTLKEIKFSPYQDSPPGGSNSIGTLNRPPDYEKTVKTFKDEEELVRVVGTECLLFDSDGFDVEDFGATLQFAENGLVSPKLWEKLYVYYRLTDKTEFMMHVYFEELDETPGFPLRGAEMQFIDIGGVLVKRQVFERQSNASRMLFVDGGKTYEVTISTTESSPDVESFLKRLILSEEKSIGPTDFGDAVIGSGNTTTEIITTGQK